MNGTGMEPSGAPGEGARLVPERGGDLGAVSVLHNNHAVLGGGVNESPLREALTEVIYAVAARHRTGKGRRTESFT